MTGTRVITHWYQCADYAIWDFGNGAYFACLHSPDAGVNDGYTGCILSIPGDGGGSWSCTWTPSDPVNRGTCVYMVNNYCYQGTIPTL